MKKNVSFKLQYLIFKVLFYKRLIRKVKNVRDLQDLHWIDKYLKYLPVSLDPNDRILTINVENLSDKKQVAILFDPLMINKPNPKIKIWLSESSCESLNLDLLSSTFVVQSLKYHVLKRSQLYNDLRICSATTTGCMDKAFLMYDNKVNSAMGRIEYNETEFPIINFPRTAFILNKHTFWEITLDPKERVNLVLLILAKIDNDKILI